jgi:hypothetical protein
MYSRSLPFGVWRVVLVAGSIVVQSAFSAREASAQVARLAYADKGTTPQGQWDRMLRSARKPVEGRIAETYTITTRSEGRKSLAIVVSLKNLNENVVEIRGSTGPVHPGFEPSIVPVLRGDDGKFIPWGASGGVWPLPSLGMGSSGSMHQPWLTLIEPGCAAGAVVPLDKGLGNAPPGKYTLLMEINGAVAKPLRLEIRDQGQKRQAVQSEEAEWRSTDVQTIEISGSLDEQWEKAIPIAGMAQDGLSLESIVSPVDPSSVHFAVSLRNIATDVRPRTIKAGRIASHYRILVRDRSGKCLPMLERGGYRGYRTSKEAAHWPPHVLSQPERFGPWVEDASDAFRLDRLHAHDDVIAFPGDRMLDPGEAVGFVFPLERLFAVQPGQEYEVLAVLPDVTGDGGALVAAPLRIRVPEAEIPGVTRPPRASEAAWDKLIALAGRPAADLELLARLDGDVFGRLDLCLRLKNVGSRSLPYPPLYLRTSHGNGTPEDENPFQWSKFGPHQLVVLVRGDLPGTTVPGNANVKTMATWRSTWEDGILLPYRLTSECHYPLHLTYPLRRGRHYTVLAAVILKGDINTTLVADPRGFSMPESSVDTTALAEPPWSVDAARANREKPTAEQRWQELSRFAGKSYEGLVLDASLGADGEDPRLRIALRNVSDHLIHVKTWHGTPRCEPVVRGPDGKFLSQPARMTPPPTMLDSAELKPGESLTNEVCLAVGGYSFDMHAPGEYTVLATMPVLGDVDAVYTAKPIKVKVGGKRGPGTIGDEP